VTGQDWLTRSEAAARAGLAVATFAKYLTRTRARVKDGLPLRPTDAPLPDGGFGSAPYWLTATVDAYNAARAGQTAAEAGLPAKTQEVQP
jgi:hypothetical protein